MTKSSSELVTMAGEAGGPTMTSRAKPDHDDIAPPTKLDIQRVRVNREGYDDTGAYWGAGPDVFIATSPDGRDEIAVRARTIKEARQKIAAELLKRHQSR